MLCPLALVSLGAVVLCSVVFARSLSQVALLPLLADVVRFAVVLWFSVQVSCLVSTSFALSMLSLRACAFYLASICGCTTCRSLGPSSSAGLVFARHSPSSCLDVRGGALACFACVPVAQFMIQLLARVMPLAWGLVCESCSLLASGLDASYRLALVSCVLFTVRSGLIFSFLTLFLLRLVFFCLAGLVYCFFCAVLYRSLQKKGWKGEGLTHTFFRYRARFLSGLFRFPLVLVVVPHGSVFRRRDAYSECCLSSLLECVLFVVRSSGCLFRSV